MAVDLNPLAAWSFAVVERNRPAGMNPISKDTGEAASELDGLGAAHSMIDAEQVTPHPPIDRRAWIAVTAYGMAERRGFEPGHELEDWLQAEKQVQFEITGEGRTF